MPPWTELPKDQLKNLLKETQAVYGALKKKNLALDMTRGKPSSAQLDLSDELLALPGRSHFLASGTDCRNYGGLDGLSEAKALFAPMMDTTPEHVLVGGNSSLTLMHDTVWRALTYGVPGGERPWYKETEVKFLCPVPGYDRHFAILENFGITMIPVPLGPDGPDLAITRSLLAADPTIKGMFCVPKYSNPTGTVYSDEVICELVAMPTAAPDFRLFWDNAYAIHFLFDKPKAQVSVLAAAAKAGHPNRPLVFGSTSKITFAGAGISFLSASIENLNDAKRHLGMQTIGPDKINILRHVAFLKTPEGLLAHMAKHANILRPKFEIIQTVFKKEFLDTGIVQWTRPDGGYFVSLDTLPGCAKRVVGLADEAGVKLTKAGATFPKGLDPEDSNIRLAPSLPPLAEVETAMEAVAICVKLASLEKLLS